MTYNDQEEQEEQFDYILKVILSGDAAVGKTNILSVFVNNQFKADATTTIGVEFQNKTIELSHEGKQYKIKLQLWDTAGQEQYRAVTTSYYRGAAGALLIYDITRHETYDKCEEWVRKLKEVAGNECQIMLVGNKCDLENERKVAQLEGQNLADKMGALFLETSALQKKNISEAFNLLVKQVVMTQPPNQIPEKKLQIQNIEQKQKKGCC